MKPTSKPASFLTGTLAVLTLLGAMPVASGAESKEQRVAALKKSMADSQAALRQYEWIETTVVSMKGEEKSRQQHRCYYGADGVLQKVPVAPPPEKEKKGGLRGRAVEKKKEEMTAYMKDAVALVKSYVPPAPAEIEAAKQAGKVSVDVLEPGKRVRLNLRDYHKAGDTLAIEMDLKTNRLLGFSVATWLENKDDKVGMTAAFASLNDGTVYMDTVRLDAQGKKLSVAVDNSGYRKTAK